MTPFREHEDESLGHHNPGLDLEQEEESLESVQPEMPWIRQRVNEETDFEDYEGERANPEFNFEGPEGGFRPRPFGTPRFRSRRWQRIFGSEPGGQVSGETDYEGHEGETGADGVWTGSPDQQAFRQRVMAAHVERSRKRKGPAQPDLSRGQLAPVRGVGISMRADAAEAASRLFEAASADLAQARSAGHPDALRTIRLTAGNGYRGSDLQARLWLGHFADTYYNETRQGRVALPGGPHSDRAVAYILNVYKLPNRIAAPGYSNHQAGIAIDFRQERVKGDDVRVNYKAKEQAKWRATWFYQWLEKNAARFGFQPYVKEAWHWEYRPDAARTRTSAAATMESEYEIPQSPRQYLGGLIHTFTSKSVPVKVSVFCPKAALSKQSVDVLVYAHGLVHPCKPVPKNPPEDFITGAPFKLGDIVEASGRGVVLIVPFFDWNSSRQYSALGKPANLNHVIEEALAEAGRLQRGAPPSVTSLILAGHSRAYGFLEPLAKAHADPQMRRGPLAKLTEVWSLDATYAGDPDSWIHWLNSNPNLKASIFFRNTPHVKNELGKWLGTVHIGREFYRRMKAGGGRLKVIPVNPASEGHCGMPGRRLPVLLRGPDAAESAELEEALASGKPATPPKRRVRVCEPDRCTNEYIQWMQTSLNQVLAQRLQVTGKLDDPTLRAIDRFKRHAGLKIGGSYHAGPMIERALIAAGAAQPPAVAPSQCGSVKPEMLIPILEQHRGDIPLAILLGWIDVESGWRLEPATTTCERGLFQLYPEDSIKLGLDHDLVGTDAAYSARAGILMLNRARKTIDKVCRTYGIPRGGEFYWRLLKLWHWIPSGPEKILARMRTKGVASSDFDSIRNFVKGDFEFLTRSIKRDPRDGVVGVDNWYRHVEDWEKKLP